MLFKSNSYLEVVNSFEESESVYSYKYESLFYYAHSLLSLNEDKKSGKYFDLIVEYFSEKYQGYEGLYLIAEKKINLIELKIFYLSYY